MRRGLVVLTVGMVALLVACSDDSGTTNPGGGGSGDGGSPSEGGASDGGSPSNGGSADGGMSSGGGGGALSFESDVWPLLSMERDPPLTGDTTSCNGCHSAGAGGLATPDVDTALANILEVPSSSALCEGMLRVVPGAPDESCYVVFYEQRLRDGLGWVDQAETDLVRAWVESGAAP